MTPKETQIVIDCYLERLDREWKELRMHAWLVAGLSRQKELPELDKFINPPPPKTEAELAEDKKYFENMRAKFSKRGDE